MKKTILTSLLVVFAVLLSAQTKLPSVQTKGPSFLSQNAAPKLRNCFSVEMEQKLRQKYPERLDTEAFETRMAQLLKSTANRRVEEQVYRIPTIVHVVHNGQSLGNTSNIPVEQVTSQFEVLNDDFRRRGAGANDSPVGADILIEFFPAEVDPDGNVLDEPGINRFNGGQSAWGEADIENDLKPNSIWDPEKYFNIWVVEFGGDLDGVLGYAQFPSMSGLQGLGSNEGPADTDGIVIGYQYFGTTGNAQAPFNGGRTTTHEVGHWLGLRHIWGDGDCSVDDFCADTPNAGEPNYGCPSNDSCPGDGSVDMVENYMDYTNDACMNIFTLDQKARMRTVLEVSPRRNSLVLPPCEEAASVSVGTTSVSPPAWYTYTANQDEVLTISSVGQTNQNTFLSVYPNCNASATIFVDDVLGTKQSEFSSFLQSGTSIYFLWDTQDSVANFDFELSTSAAEDGAACALAGMAAEGTNNVSASNLDIIWYEFTMNADLSKILLDMSGNKTSIYRGDCDQLKFLASTDTTLVLNGVPVGETIYLAIEAEGEAFDFDLQVSALAEGEACLSAVAIDSGFYVSPEREYWYLLESEGFGELIFETSMPGDINIFEGCEGDRLSLSSLTASDELVIPVSLGQEIKIQWVFEESSADYEWSVAYEAFPEGAVCETALSVDADTLTADSGAPIWYDYTMPQDGTLTISSIGLTNEDTFVAVFASCDSEEPIAFNDDFEEGLQSQVVIPQLSQGDEIKIWWLDAYSSGVAFDWTISVRDDIPGEFCQNAAMAMLGENMAVVTGTNVNWYTFIPTEANKKLVMQGNLDEFGGFLVGDCDDGFEVLGSGIGAATLVDYEVGAAIYIVWENFGETDYSWTLSLEDLEEGNTCSTALSASAGTNTTATHPSWYTYTMTQNGSLRISSIGSTTEDTFLALYDECGGDVVLSSDDEGDGFQSELIINDLAIGEQVLFQWAPVWTSADFDWELEEFVPPFGSTCFSATLIDRPRQILSGGAPDWYSFVMPKAGDLVISSLGLTNRDTYVEAYNACGSGGDLIGISDNANDTNQSKLTVSDLEAGDTVIFHWADFYTTAAFVFEVYLENASNNAPNTTDQAFELDYLTVDGDVIGTIQAEDADDDQLLFFAEEIPFEMVSLNQETGEMILEDREAFLEYRQDLILNVVITDGVVDAMARITLINNLLGLDESPLSIYPNPASTTVNIVFEGKEILGGSITDLSGRIMKSIHAGQSELNVSDVEAGIYFVRVDFSEGSITRKLIVE